MKIKKILLIALLLIATAIILTASVSYSPIKKENRTFLFALPEPKKGLAMAYPQFQEDFTAIGENTWYYIWTTCPTGADKCVSMSWCGEDPNLPVDYSNYVLLFNEPENPKQCNITPQQGVDYYTALHIKYPDIKWVVGNSIFWGSWQNWLNSFWNICNATPECKMPEYWGIHIYFKGSPELYIPFVESELTRLHDKIGGIFWVTEFAEISGNTVTDNALVNLFKKTPWIARWAYFTNRSQTTDPWIIDGWKIDLFDWNTGISTDIGNWYMHGLNKIMLPIVIR